MRLLLAQAPFRDTFGYSMPPPGLLRLGGELQRRGYPVQLEDLAFRLAAGELARGRLMCESAARWLVKRGEFDVVGLSVMGATLPAALEITRRLRELRPHAKLLLGGPGMTGADKIVLERFPWIDAVVRGEAEQSLPRLLDRFAADRDASGLAGISWRDAHGTIHVEENGSPMADLNGLAPYARDLLPPLADYKRITGETEGLTPLDSGRGCVFDCSFCTIGRYWNRRSRTLPAARLVDEIHALDDLAGARNAYLCHDIFGADREHAVQFCELLIERGVRPWECRARVDHLDRPLLQLMARAGCYRVLLGIESGAPKVRAAANKGQFEELEVPDVVRHCAAVGIRPILSLILGLPGEGQAELEASLELVAHAALITDALISLHLPNPQIGCELHETHGYGSRPIDGIAPDMAFGSGETEPERALIEAHPDLFSSWSLLPGDEEDLRRLYRIATQLPPVLTGYPRTWALLQTHLGMGHLGLFWAWQTSTKGFASFAQETGDGLVLDALTWECAIAAQSAIELPATPPAHGWVQSRATVIRLDHDLPKITKQLTAGAPHIRPASPSPTCLAITNVPDGIATDRVSSGVAELLQHLASPCSLEQLELRWPDARETLDALARAGLVTHPLADFPLESQP